MGLWCRIKHSNLKILCRQFSISYFRINDPCLANYATSNTRIWNKPDRFCPKGPTGFACNVRFFAVPLKFQVKPTEEDVSGTRLNEEITAKMVRLIVDEGNHTGNYVVTIYEALQRAKELELDLVEVQRTANPPVCKIMDFHREKYQKEVRLKERAKSKVSLKSNCKEIKFSEKTELKDLKMKANMVKRLTEKGYRVKCVVVPKGKRTEDEGLEDLKGLLSRLFELIEEDSLVESGPLVEKSQASMVVRHVKFGAPKKSSGKKAFKAVGASSTEVQKESVLPPNKSVSSSTQRPILEDLSHAESGLETDEILPDEEDATEENHETTKGAWSVCDADDEFDQVFDVSDDGEEMDSVSRTPFSPTDVGISDIIQSRPVLDTKKANTHGTDNRYKTSEPSNRYPPTKSGDGKASNVKGSVRVDPQSQYQGKRLQLDLNESLSTQNTKEVGTDSATFKNSRLPNEIPSQGPSRPGTPSPPVPSYGIFSAQKANAPGRPGIAAVSNRNREGSPTDFIKGPGTPSSPVSSYGIFSGQKANAPGRPGIAAEGNRNRQGSPTDFSEDPGTPSPPVSSYGIFSGQKANPPGRPGVAAEGNRNNEGSPRDFASRPSTPSPPGSSYGIFGGQKANVPSRPGVAAEGNRNKGGSPIDFTKGPGAPSPPVSSFGIFSGQKADPPSTPGVAVDGNRNEGGSPSDFARGLGAPKPPVFSYGIFSSQKANASDTQSLAAQGNMSKEGSPTDYTMGLRNKAASGNSNSPTDDSERPGIDRGGRRQWGIFSGNGSNVTPK